MARFLAQLNFEIPTACLPVLTGAGASVAFGYPLVESAPDQLGQLLWHLPEDGHGGTSRRGRTKHYLNWIAEEMGNLGEHLDLESFLLTLRTHVSYVGRGAAHGFASRILRSAPRLITNDDLSVLEGLRDLELGVKEYIHQTYGLPPSEAVCQQVAECYRELDPRIARPVALFTTNYDPLAENVPELIGKEPLDGFRRARVGSPETWDPAALSEFDVSRHLPVLHLHGSASWFEIEAEIRRYPGLGLGAGGVRSMLIYPGEAKDDLDAEQSDVSQLAYNYLAQSASKQGALVAIGYSFRDAAVGRALQLAAGYRQKLIRLVVFAPSLDEYVERLVDEPHIDGVFVRGKFENPDPWSPILGRSIRNAST